MKLLLSRQAHFKVMAVGLEPASAILPSPLCIDPILPLVAIQAIFKATRDSLSAVPKDKG